MLENVPPQTSPVYSWFFLAMTHHRLGHDDETRAWLQKAIDQAEHEIQGNPPWNRRATLKLLRDEAEALLNGMEVPDLAKEPTTDE